MADTSIFGKVHTYTFSDEQLKKILVDLLLLSGETIPQNVSDKLEPDGFTHYDAEVNLQCETAAEVAEAFSIKLTFTDTELADYIQNYNEQLAAKNGEEPPDQIEAELPDNVWTQNSKIPCGKE